MATSEAGGTSDRNVRLKYRSEGVNLSDVASMIVNMGYKPCSEFHTLMPMSVPKNCIAQFSSPEIKRDFVSRAQNDPAALEVFRVFRPQKVILCNRVPMEMNVETLEDLLFPPRIRGKVEIARRHVEQCKDKDGKPLCYTGRVFFYVYADEFDEVKHVMPTSIPWVCDNNKYCVFIKFDGSIQRCHHCNEPGHIESACPTKMSKEKEEMKKLHETVLKSNTSVASVGEVASEKIKPPSNQSTPVKRKGPASSSPPEAKRMNESMLPEEKQNTTSKEKETTDVTGKEYLDQCFPGWRTCEKTERRRLCSKQNINCKIAKHMKKVNEEEFVLDIDKDMYVPLPIVAIPICNQDYRHKLVPYSTVYTIMYIINSNIDQFVHHPQFDYKSYKMFCLTSSISSPNFEYSDEKMCSDLYALT